MFDAAFRRYLSAAPRWGLYNIVDGFRGWREPALMGGIMRARRKRVTKKRVREEMAAAGSLKELKETIEALEEEAGEVLVAYYGGVSAPKLGGKVPKHCLDMHHPKAVECGLIRSGRRFSRSEIISWDESSVLARGAKGLMIMDRESFEECFSEIVCPFCGERFIYGFSCDHAVVINDMMLEHWIFENAEKVYCKYLEEHGLEGDYFEHVPKALPGAILGEGLMEGRGYNYLTVVQRVWFVPDEMVEKLRNMNKS